MAKILQRIIALNHIHSNIVSSSISTTDDESNSNALASIFADIDIDILNMRHEISNYFFSNYY